MPAGFAFVTVSATRHCIECACPLDIPGDRLSDDWGGACRYCITKALDDELGRTDARVTCEGGQSIAQEGMPDNCQGDLFL